MRYRIRHILLHICLICSLDCVAAMVLDWYNPFMDFAGHIVWVRMTLYMAILLLTINEYAGRKQNNGHKPKKETAQVRKTQ